MKEEKQIFVKVFNAESYIGVRWSFHFPKLDAGLSSISICSSFSSHDGQTSRLSEQSSTFYLINNEMNLLSNLPCDISIDRVSVSPQYRTGLFSKKYS